MFSYLIVLQVVGIPRLLPPGALDGVAVDVGVVDGDNGVGGGLLRGKPEKGSKNIPQTVLALKKRKKILFNSSLTIQFGSFDLLSRAIKEMTAHLPMYADGEGTMRRVYC